MMNATTPRATTEEDLILRRSFEAPRELVFAAWTEPERLVRWWGPRGYTTPFCTVDLRPGGIFRFCMKSPEGREFWGRGVYGEVVAPERLVWIDSFTDAGGNVVQPSHYGLSAEHPGEMLVTVTFTENDGKTEVTLRHAIPRSVPERSGAEQGWTEMFDRLATEVAR